MKIGIVTLWGSTDNYGQLLQCYALQEHLRDLGHSPYLIRYKFEYSPIGNPLINKIKRNLSIERICYLLSKERKLQQPVSAERSRLNAELNLQRRFDDFRTENIAVSDKVYYKVEDVINNPPLADAYICGSDQIWKGVYSYKESEVQLLEFGKPDSKRIAYAASMGGSTLRGGSKKRFKESLSRFCAIGLREQSLKELCDNVGHTDSKVVLDPTLLLSADKYLVFCDNTRREPAYIFFYILNIYRKEELYWDSLEQYISHKGVDTKVVYSSGYVDYQDILPNRKGLQATIPEWLSYIKNAESVVTTSFHGVVFCIKMNRPFLAILLQGKHAGGNNRIIDLLNTLGLNNRIFDPSLPVEVQMERNIDWCSVNQKLEELAKDSINFLDLALCQK